VTAYAASLGAYLAASAVLYVLFLAKRAAVTAIARVPGRLPPFGEAPAASLRRASLFARLGLMLVGPAAVYGLVVLLLALAIHRGGEIKEGSTVVSPMPSGPAAEAGFQDGDRIKAVNGRPITAFEEIRPLIANHAGDRIDVVVERSGRMLRIPVTPGPIGSVWQGRLGVEKMPEPVALGAAFRSALAQPLEALAARLRPRSRVRADLVGPIGITQGAAELNRPPLAERMLKMAALTGVGALDVYVLLALFLFPSRRRDIAATLSLPPSPPRPWVRLVARIVDVAVFVFVLGLISVAVNPDLVEAAGNSLVLLTIPIEAALLATWGATPGKALLGISVRDAGGGKLSFGAALRRAAAVWTFGLAANQSMILVTALMSWRRLRRRGATYWDALDGHRVDHHDVGTWQILVAVVVVVLAIAWFVAIQYRTVFRDL